MHNLKQGCVFFLHIKWGVNEVIKVLKTLDMTVFGRYNTGENLKTRQL